MLDTGAQRALGRLLSAARDDSHPTGSNIQARGRLHRAFPGAPAEPGLRDVQHALARERLESLVLMYCRDTTDAATEQIAGLRRLKSYFASYTGITDRSMEILAGMPSLERVSFYGCPGVTDAGVAALTRLPRLREVDISGPNITREGLAVFPAHVRVEDAV